MKATGLMNSCTAGFVASMGFVAFIGCWVEYPFGYRAYRFICVFERLFESLAVAEHLSVFPLADVSDLLGFSGRSKRGYTTTRTHTHTKHDRATLARNSAVAPPVSFSIRS